MILGIGTLVLVVIIAVGGTLAMRGFMRPASTDADAVEHIGTGERVEVVGQIVGIDGSTLTVEVLEGNGYDVWDTRTGTFLSMEGGGSADVVMGTADDVAQGAIAQFEGEKTGTDTVQLERIVILTGYVEGPDD